MESKLKLGSKAPNFYLKGVDNTYYSLDSFKDKKLLLVVFSCNHCPYVKAYEKRLIELQQDFSNSELQVVCINSNDDINYPEDSFEKMVERDEEAGFNFPYLRDDTQEIAKTYGASFTPELFLFNHERALVYSGKIDDNWQEPEKVRIKYLRNAIEEYLNNQPISVPETFAIGCTIKWKNY